MFFSLFPKKKYLTEENDEIHVCFGIKEEKVRLFLISKYVIRENLS